MIYALDGQTPIIAPGCFVAPNAAVIGNVVLEESASVWFSVTIRGDKDRIVVGAGSNIQDGAVLHADPGSPLVIGPNVTVGHLAMLHGCRGCLIGAGALITEGKEIPDFSLVMGAPGKVVRTLDETAQARLLASAASYRDNAARFRQGLKPIAG